ILFFFKALSPPETYTLSLHDALPIYPRLRWIDPLAPVRNYAALLTALAECWECKYLPRERTALLLQILFGSFIRSEWSAGYMARSEEHTSELQSQSNLVCRLLLEKKK